MNIIIVENSRAESAPLESVRAALPEASVARYDAAGMSPAVAMSQALTYFTVVYTSTKPKLVIVLGDRYETLAAALAAFFLRIPIAHIHGGETTTGAFDDAFRHSITHMATLHFAPTWKAAEKIHDMTGYTGQSTNPAVHLVGAPGLDGIEQNSAKRNSKLFLCTYHPETRAPDLGVGGCAAMLSAFDAFPDYQVLFCGVNADPGSEAIRGEILQWVNGHASRAAIEPTLSHADYVAWMQRGMLVIGNSSAGIIEAPWVGVPTVNLGMRQNGRPMADSVFSLHTGKSGDVEDMIHYALAFTGDPLPQYSGGAAPKIASIVRAFVNQT